MGVAELGLTGAVIDRLSAVPQGSRMLAALGNRMLGLARVRSGGAVPVLATPEYTASARAVLGDAVLAQRVTDHRRAGADHLAVMLVNPADSQDSWESVAQALLGSVISGQAAGKGAK